MRRAAIHRRGGGILVERVCSTQDSVPYRAKCSHSTVRRAGRREGEGYSGVWELTGDGTRAVAKVTTDSIPRLS